MVAIFAAPGAWIDDEYNAFAGGDLPNWFAQIDANDLTSRQSPLPQLVSQLPVSPGTSRFRRSRLQPRSRRGNCSGSRDRLTTHETSPFETTGTEGRMYISIGGWILLILILILILIIHAKSGNAYNRQRLCAFPRRSQRLTGAIDLSSAGSNAR